VKLLLPSFSGPYFIEWFLLSVVVCLGLSSFFSLRSHLFAFFFFPPIRTGSPRTSALPKLRPGPQASFAFTTEGSSLRFAPAQHAIARTRAFRCKGLPGPSSFFILIFATFRGFPSFLRKPVVPFFLFFLARSFLPFLLSPFPAQYMSRSHPSFSQE